MNPRTTALLITSCLAMSMLFPASLHGSATSPKKLFQVMTQGFSLSPKTDLQTTYDLQVKLENDVRDVQFGVTILNQEGTVVLREPIVTQKARGGDILNQRLPILISDEGHYEMFVSLKVTNDKGYQSTLVRHLFIQSSKAEALVSDTIPVHFYEAVARRNKETQIDPISDLPPTPISVSGRITFYDADLDATIPLGGAIVRVENFQICDPDCRPNPLYWEYREVQADDNGYYYVPNWFVVNTKVTVRIDNGIAFYGEGDFFPQPCLIDSRFIYGNITGANVNVTSEVAHILDNLRKAGQFTSANWGWVRPRISFQYHAGTGVSAYNPNTDDISFYQYFPGSSSSEIWETCGREVSSHEYGHGVMYSAFGGMPLPDWSPQPGQYHNAFTVSGPVFAWIEGWAEFFSAAVWPNDVGNDSFYFELNPFMSSPYYRGETGTNIDGRLVEGAVANFLWNLFDGVSTPDGRPGDNDDVNSLGFSLWNSFRNGMLIGITGVPRNIHSVQEFKYIWDNQVTGGEYSIYTSAPGPREISSVFGKVLYGTPNLPTGSLSGVTGVSNMNRVLSLNWLNNFDDINPPSANLVYRKEVAANDTWDGTLTGFAQVGSVSYNGSAFQDQVPVDGVFYRYVLVTINSGGISQPFSSTRIYAARTFLVNIDGASYIEAGSGGTYRIDNGEPVATWSGPFLENSPTQIKVDAVPPNSDWRFVRWSDDTKSTPYFLTPGGNITLSAIFKKHLMSTSPTFSGPNGQRKVDSFSGSASHAVYESNGSIFYIQNYGNGWTNEVCIAAAIPAIPPASAIYHKNPSIATSVDGSVVVHVVWERVINVDGHDYHDVYYRSSTNTGATWNDAIRITLPAYLLPSSPGATDIDATPVVTGGTHPVIVYKSGGSSTGALHVQVGPSWWGGSMQHYVVDGSDASSRAPSLVPANWGQYKLVYSTVSANLDKIYYREFNVYESSPHIIFDGGQSADLSTEYPWMTNCANPSVAFDGSNVFVAWDAFASMQRIDQGAIQQPRHVFCRQRIPVYGWQPVAEFDYYGTYQKNASVGINPNVSPAKVVLQWEGNAQILKSSRNLAPGTWANTSNLGSGVLPSLTHCLSAANAPYAMYTSGASSPYAVSFNTNFTRPVGQTAANNAGEVGPKTDPMLFDESTHRATVNLDSLVFGHSKKGVVTGQLWIDSPAFEVVAGTSRIRVPFVVDTLDFSEWMGTVRRVIAADADFVNGKAKVTLTNFSLLDRHIDLNTPIMTTTVLHGNNGQQPVNRLTIGDLVRLGVKDTAFNISFRIPAKSYQNNSLRIQQRLIGQDVQQQPAWSSLIESDSTNNSATLEGELSTMAVPGNQAMPTEFAMHQNYPNPFNPSTTISYDLPEQSRVSLAVYDVLGRRITELVNGQVSEGYHTALWNASGVASGMYFARFTATDEKGQVKLSKVSKLLLTK